MIIGHNYFFCLNHFSNPLEVETRLYYLSVPITTDTSHVQVGCSRTRN